MAKASGAKADKTGEKREYRIGNKKPPVETRFKQGNQAAKGHGRPRDLKQLRSLIQRIAAEPSTVKPDLSKLEAMIDRMLISPQAADRKEILRYGWGEVQSETTTLNVDVSKLTDEQLERIAKGEDVRAVFATASTSRDGTAETAEGAGPPDNAAGVSP